MSLPVVLTNAAQADYDDAYDWYEAARSGAGNEFARRVHFVFARIAANPLLHAKVFGDVRRAVVRQRPFIVLYILEPARVVVISVFHTSRDPQVWQSRV